MQHIFECYKDNAGEWRWRIKHSNGNILLVSSEGYKNKQDMFDVLVNLAEAFFHVKRGGPAIFHEMKS